MASQTWFNNGQQSPFRPVGVAHPVRTYSSPTDSGFDSDCSPRGPRPRNRPSTPRRTVQFSNRRSRSVSRQSFVSGNSRSRSVPANPKSVPTLAVAPFDWCRRREVSATVWQFTDDGGFLSVGSGVVPFDRHRTTLDGMTLDTDDLDKVLCIDDELVLTDVKLNQGDQRQIDMEFAINIKCKNQAQQEHPWITHAILQRLDHDGASISVRNRTINRVILVNASADAFKNGKGRTITDFFEGQSVLCRLSYKKMRWTADTVVQLQPILTWNEQDTTVIIIRPMGKCGFMGIAHRHVYIPSSALRRSRLDRRAMTKGIKFRATLVPNVWHPADGRGFCPFRAIQLYPLCMGSTLVPVNNTQNCYNSDDLIQL